MPWGLQKGELRRPGRERERERAVSVWRQAEHLAGNVVVGDEGEHGPATTAGAGKDVLLENAAQEPSPIQARRGGLLSPSDPPRSPPSTSARPAAT